RQSYLSEQAVIFRSQELNQKEEWLVTRGHALQEQAEELSRREQSLAKQLQQWGAAQQELATLEETNRTGPQDTTRQRAMLETLRSETEALQRSREVAGTEFEAMVKAMKGQKEARAREEAARAAAQAHLDQRLQKAERSETAMQQRLAELDDLERRLYQ